MDTDKTNNSNKNHLEQEELNRYVTFSLGGEVYGIAINKVKEIIGVTDITPVPRLPNFFLGVINVRGKIISVMELRKKLNIVDDKTPSKSIIILEVNNMTLGIVIGNINEVVTFQQDHLQSKAEVKSKLCHDHIAAVARPPNKKLITILDVDRIFAVDELKIPIKKDQVI